MATYNLSGVVANPANNEPLTQPVAGVPTPMTIRDAIIVAFKMPAGQNEQISETDLNFRRKIVIKLKKAEDLSAISLKDKAVTACKEVARKYYIPGVSMQILDAFDGEPTQAEMDEV